jgi:hypothetical protein
MIIHRRLFDRKRRRLRDTRAPAYLTGAMFMNRNLTTVAFSIAALGLVAAFDIIAGAGISARIAMLATGGMLLINQLVESTSLRLQWS